MVALAAIFMEHRGWMAFMPIAMFGWIPALFWPVNVAMGPWLMGFAVLAGLGLAWEPCIHSFLEAWVRGLDACLEVLWGQWPDQ